MLKKNQESQLPYRLGIDIGTASVAWAAIGLNDRSEPQRLLATGLTIFGEPVLPKEMKLKSDARRAARLMRRQIERKRERIEKILHIAESLGVNVGDLQEALKAHKHTQALWELRVKALDERVTLPELFLIILRLAKNRGYNGEPPAPNKKGELGKVGQGLAATQSILASAPGARTVAEALWKRERNSPAHQKSFRKLVDSGSYVLRRDVEHEFDLVLAQQRSHHKILSAPLADVLGAEFVSKLQRDKDKPRSEGAKHFWGRVPETVDAALRVTTFYQRPLHAFKDKIGRCSLDKSSLRVVAAHPAHQSFRVEKILSDLRWGDSKTGEKLSAQQKALLRQKLLSQKEVKFSAVYALFGQKGLMHPDGLILNMHTPRREYLRGNTTRQLLDKLDLLSAFDALSPGEQGGVFAAMSDDVNAPEAWGHDGTRDTIVRAHGENVAAFIDLLAQSNGGLERLTAIGFETARTAYGAPALWMLAETMRENEFDERAAKDVLFPGHDRLAAPDGVLPPIAKLDIRSPVVTHALEYTRREINTAMKRLGLPSAVVLELAREMKSSLEQRTKTTARQRREESENEQARLEIIAANCRVTQSSLLRYKLWKQQARRCPYSGQPISIEDALNGGKFEVEHIIPIRLHGVGNRFEDVVLASRQFNKLKAESETPYIAASRLGPTKWNWEQTEQAVKLIANESADFRKSKARIILDRTPFARSELDDEEFVERQLQETQWIGRALMSWCKHICTDVTVVRGSLTAELRAAWGLDTVIEQVRSAEGRHESAKTKQLFYKPNRVGELRFDKRSDHRQHLVDACVIALSTRAHYMAAVSARRGRRMGLRGYVDQRLACPIPTLRDHLVRMLTGYEVWHVPDRKVSGLMFDQEPFGLAGDGQTLTKKRKQDKRRFNPKVDLVVTHTDRHGRQHSKALVKTEAACIRVTQDGWETVNIPAYRARYLKDGKLFVPAGERLILKGDLLIVPGKSQVFRVAQLKEGDGVCCIPTTETCTFEDLKGSGLNKIFGKASDLFGARVVRHPVELAIHSRTVKAELARAD